MFLKKFLTDYDENLNIQINIDPLGMLVIWSAFGQKVFNSRVNSISNDVRNYTLNLFNHYMVRRIVNDDSVVLSKKLEEKYTSKDALGFKQACLLYLENLFVYSLLKHEESKDINDVKIDTLGVLGGLNGRRRWEKNDRNPTLTFSTGKEGEILVRQLGLGVSGRYKTPLREIGFFDNNYNYDKDTTLWNKAKSLVQKSQLEDLSDLLYEHFKKLLEQNTEKPEFHFGDLPLEVSQAFAKAFPSSGVVGIYSSDFWLDVSGLNMGAAGSILAVLKENKNLTKAKDLLYAAIEKISSDKDKIDDEEQKLKDIQTLEPFLANAMLLFTLMASDKSQSISDVEKSWKEEFQRNEETLPNLAKAASELIQNLDGTAKNRFSKLLELSQINTFTEQIEYLLKYHESIMSVRDQHPWVTRDGDKLKVYIRPMSDPSLALDKWQAKDTWHHSYYLPEFQNLVRGFQGVIA